MIEGLPTLVRYLVVGAVTNLLLLLCFSWLNLYLPAIAASSLVFVTGIAISYSANKNWSFKSPGRHRREAPRYILAYLAGYAVQLTVLTMVIHFTHHAILAQAVAMVVAAAVIFAMLKLFVFARIS